MPTYFATDTKVHLCVSDLTKSTTAHPEQRKSTSATAKAEAADTSLKGGRRLHEDTVACCEDRGRLHFLGKHKDMPFFLVHVGADLFKPHFNSKDLGGSSGAASSTPPDRNTCGVSTGSFSTLTSLASTPTGSEPDRIENERQGSSAKRTTSATTKDATDNTSSKRSRAGNSIATDSRFPIPSCGPSVPAANAMSPTVPLSLMNLHHATVVHPIELIPQALTLVISLTDKSFLRSFVAPHIAQDVKLDVFFNGEFACSKYVAARYRIEKSKTSELTQQISGIRVHRLLEHAWVILPPGQNPDGSLRGLKRTKSASVGSKERWDQIAAALRKEADELGFDEHDCRPPVGDYLASLAGLEMPDAVTQMQRPGGLKFGVVDVVLSVGRGKKYDSSSYYLTNPERLHNDDFTIRTGAAGDTSHGLPTSLPSSSLDSLPAHNSTNPFALPSAPPVRRGSSVGGAGLPRTDPSPETLPRRQDLSLRKARALRNGTAPVSSTSNLSDPMSSSPPWVGKLFPPISSLPSQDFDSTMTSSVLTKSKSSLRQKMTPDTQQPSALSYQPFSSSEDGHHRRGQMRVSQGTAGGFLQPHFRNPFSTTTSQTVSESFSLGLSQRVPRSTPATSATLCTSQQGPPSHQLSMGPPKTPVLPATREFSSALTSTGLRSGSSPGTGRYAHGLSVSDDSGTSPKRRRIRRDSILSTDQRGSEGQKTVAGFFDEAWRRGVSRRGVLTRRGSLADVSGRHGEHPANEGSKWARVDRSSHASKRTDRI